MSQVLEKVWELVTIYGLKVVAAIVILIIGRWVAKGISKLIGRMMEKGKVDHTVQRFTVNMAYIALMVFVVLAALSQLGIQTTSFIAVLGADLVDLLHRLGDALAVDVGADHVGALAREDQRGGAADAAGGAGDDDGFSVEIIRRFRHRRRSLISIGAAL